MYKYAKNFLLCLLSGSFLCASALSGACEESFEKLPEQGSKVLNSKKDNDLSISEVTKLVNHLENNVFSVLQRATTNQDVTVRLEALEGINKLGVQLIRLVERGLNHSDVEVRREALKTPIGLLYNVIMTNIDKLHDPNVEVQNQARQTAGPFLRNLLHLMNRVSDMQDEKLNQSVAYLRAHVLSLQQWVFHQG